MIVKLQEHIIEITQNINGKVISKRFQYTITVKQHWWKFWEKPKHLYLFPGWENNLEDDVPIKCQLVSKRYATSFGENASTRSKDIALQVVNLIRNCPNKFIIY